MKNFFLEIKSSIWDPAFYAGVSEKDLKSAIVYIAKLSVLLTLVSVVWFSAVVIPRVRSLAETALDALVEAYPGNAVFEMKDELLTARPRVPYKIPAIDENTKAELVRGGYEFAMVIDTTRASSTSDMFTTYKAPVVVTQSSFAFRKNDGAVEIVPFKDIPNAVITRAVVENYGSLISNGIKKLTPLFLLIVSVFFYLYFFVGTLVSMLLLALLVWAMLSLMGKTYSYGESYKMGLYGITTTLILETLVLFLPFSLVPFLGTALLLFVIYGNIKNE